MKELILTIARALVDHPDEVQVDIEEKEHAVVYRLHVHQDDVGKVIGKQGRIAKALRTVVYAAASREKKRITVEII